jgi:hypothetical protein
MKLSACVLVMSLLLITGCVNNYKKFYHSLDLDQSDYRKNIEGEEVRVVQYNKSEKEDFTKNLYKQGYTPMGYSSFNSKLESERKLKSFAKSLQAYLVVYYVEYTHANKGVVPITTPGTQTTYHSGSVYNSYGGYGSYNGSSTTYGSTTNYIPYNVSMYDHFAIYCAKRTEGSFGVRIDDVPDEFKKKHETNSGVLVTTIIDDSVAFNNDIMEGDIIYKVEGTLVTPRNLSGVLDKFGGKDFKMELFRKGKFIFKNVHID